MSAPAALSAEGKISPSSHDERSEQSSFTLKKGTVSQWEDRNILISKQSGFELIDFTTEKQIFLLRTGVYFHVSHKETGIFAKQTLSFYS